MKMGLHSNIIFRWSTERHRGTDVSTVPQRLLREATWIGNCYTYMNDATLHFWPLYLFPMTWPPESGSNLDSSVIPST